MRYSDIQVDETGAEIISMDHRRSFRGASVGVARRSHRFSIGLDRQHATAQVLYMSSIVELLKRHKFQLGH